VFSSVNAAGSGLGGQAKVTRIWSNLVERVVVPLAAAGCGCLRFAAVRGFRVAEKSDLSMGYHGLP
jgi:hypothetical protein